LSDAALVKRFKLYETRKVVRAAKIPFNPFRRPRFEDGAVVIPVMVNDGVHWLAVSEETEKRLRLMRPEHGWWLLVYEDGFISCVPPRTFEEASTPLAA
jgi:hypothetical protein